MRISDNTKGVTFIETVVALAVIVGALVGPVTLVIRGLYDFGFVKNKLIALNLAGEGIELVRLIRENNAICIDKGANGWTLNNWDRDYNGSGNLAGSQRTIDANGIPATVLCNVSGTNLVIQNPVMTTNNTCQALPLRIDGNGNYGYSGQLTIFTRCIDIQKPNVNESGPGGKTIDKKDMLDITSTVTWQDHGITRTITLTERLYNWH